MTIRFLAFGKPREKYLTLGYEEYLKRLGKYGKVSLSFFPEETLPNNPSENEIKKALDKEANRLLTQVNEKDALILLDIHSKEIDTTALAAKIEGIMALKGNLVFVIGSSYGLSDLFRQRADFSFSLSKLTLTHYFALLLTMEQVYRAMKINNHEAYDK